LEATQTGSCNMAVACIRSWHILYWIFTCRRCKRYIKKRCTKTCWNF